MEEYMASDKELLMNLIERYTDLQRIKNAQDPMKEVEDQLKSVKAQLEGFGVVTENLDINQYLYSTYVIITKEETIMINWE